MARKTKVEDFGDIPRKPRAYVTNEDISNSLLHMGESKPSFAKRMVRPAFGIMLLSMLVLSPLSIYATVFSLPTQMSSLREMTSLNYNPSVKVRYAQLGEQVIESWYEGGKQIVPVSQDIVWPTQGYVDISSKIANARNNAEDGGKTLSEELARTSPVPVVTDVSFVTGVQFEQPDNEFPNRRVEKLVYNASVNGILHTISIALRIDDLEDIATPPTLIAAPSIGTAVDVTFQRGKDTGPLGYRDWSPDENMISQLATWAKAYTEDDRATLKRLTGDKSGDNVYVGIVDGGWTYVPQTFSVVWSKIENDSDTVFGRIKWDIQTIRETGLRNSAGKPIVQKVVQTQTMDFQARGASTALLSVVSWGEPGSYASLKPLSRAYASEEAPAFGRRNVLDLDNVEVEDTPTTDDGLEVNDPFGDTSATPDVVQSTPAGAQQSGQR